MFDPSVRCEQPRGRIRASERAQLGHGGWGMSLKAVGLWTAALVLTAGCFFGLFAAFDFFGSDKVPALVGLAFFLALVAVPFSTGLFLPSIRGEIPALGYFAGFFLWHTTAGDFGNLTYDIGWGGMAFYVVLYDLGIYLLFRLGRALR